MTKHTSPANSYSIKEVAALTGLAASTLRYYEKIGLIGSIPRGQSSHQRVYSADLLDLLTSIACLSATGMSIADMRAYLGNRGKGALAADEQARLLEAQRRHLDAEAQRLRVRKQYVELKIAYWQAVRAGDDKQAAQISQQAKSVAEKLRDEEEKTDESSNLQG